MNTKVYMILKTLLDFFKMENGILKDHKGVNMRVKGSSGSSTKKMNNNTK